MKVDVLTSGYVSMDHIIKIATPAKVGFTSLVTNKSNSKIYYGGCSVNIAYALCQLGMKAMPEQRLSLQQTARSIRWKKKLKISA